jgi:transcriptional regulator with XRE-family HTH domain
MSHIVNASQFWERYKMLVKKDFRIVLKTKIQQSTLSTWKSKNTFPRADEAYEIAKAIGTTVEYLVSGQDTIYPTCSPEAFQIAVIADQLNPEGMDVLKDVIDSLKLKHPKK